MKTKVFKLSFGSSPLQSRRGIFFELKDITKPAFVISENATFDEALDMILNNHTNTLLVTKTTIVNSLAR